MVGCSPYTSQVAKPPNLAEVLEAQQTSNGKAMGFFSTSVFVYPRVPSGKRLHNYGKSPFLMGKFTINGPFSIAMLNYQGVIIYLLRTVLFISGITKKSDCP